MRTFHAVAEHGSFAAAARALDMAPAGATRLVSDLEAHLGTRLLQRTTRRLALTDSGEAYLAKLRAILGDIDEAHAEVQATTRDMRGTLRICAPPVLAVHILAPLIHDFAQLHPNVTLDIHVDAGDNQSVEDFDITLIGANQPPEGNYIARPILHGEGLLCAAPSYLKRHGSPQEPGDLARHRCLRIKQPNNPSRQWRLLHSGDSDRPLTVEVAPTMLANHADTLLRATLDGAGISSIPTDLAARHIQSGELVRVLSPWITGRLSVYVAMPTRKFIPSRTRVFVDFLIDRTKHGVATRRLGGGVA